jgi:hypothetical protein
MSLAAHALSSASRDKSKKEKLVLAVNILSSLAVDKTEISWERDKPGWWDEECPDHPWTDPTQDSIDSLGAKMDCLNSHLDEEGKLPEWILEISPENSSSILNLLENARKGIQSLSHSENRHVLLKHIQEKLGQLIKETNLLNGPPSKPQKGQRRKRKSHVVEGSSASKPDLRSPKHS